MKSKITIDMDWDNQPIIKIQYQESEDVRDKMIKRFMETFQGQSCWANFYFVNAVEKPNSEAKIRPIKPSEIEEQLILITDSLEPALAVKDKDGNLLFSIANGTEIKVTNKNGKQ